MICWISSKQLNLELSYIDCTYIMIIPQPWISITSPFQWCYKIQVNQKNGPLSSWHPQKNSRKPKARQTIHRDAVGVSLASAMSESVRETQGSERKSWGKVWFMSECQSMLSCRVLFGWWWLQYTLKNEEILKPQMEGGWKMIFLFKWVFFRFQPLIFGGFPCQVMSLLSDHVFEEIPVKVGSNLQEMWELTFC